MSKVKITRAIGGRQAGETIDVTAGVSEFLISVGEAEAVATSKPRGKSKSNKGDEQPGDTGSSAAEE